MGPEVGQAPHLARCLQLNALALAFSLAHTVADYGVIFGVPDANDWGMAAYLGVASAVYAWWGWSLARAASDGRTGLRILLVFSGVWAALLNGGSLMFIPLTNLLANVIHFGSLLFAAWAAYAAWRPLRANRVAPARAADAHA